MQRSRIDSSLRATLLPPGSEFRIVDAYSYIGKESELKYFILSDKKKHLIEAFEGVFQEGFIGGGEGLELVDKKLLSFVVKIIRGERVMEYICSKEAVDSFKKFQNDLNLFVGVEVKQSNNCLEIFFTSTESYLTYQYFKGEWRVLSPLIVK